ncbi:MULTISPECIES: alpha/beta hydrolase [Halocynthiibacter]|uniref:Alpha/beta hydrolase n=1 Tax=Halocynthiibacter halioticoli TaxID=2986804 RepID=A0AAE3LT07_9RHOB|nr:MULTISPECIES: alpha/beta hydrolase [Halocynthiibacter]MCV6824276.1 alpha/beta hydrolase [Halocynthiibacter halioticoli]MCW4057277.1 alpha/beta hydrolase [Halocynthiibacter sp. SDUM655004]
MLGTLNKTELEYCTIYNDVPYVCASLGDKEITLHSTIYLPKECKLKPPLFVWFHGGAFKFGSHNQKMAKRLGRRLSQKGIAVASVQYRLHGKAEDVSDKIASQIDEYQNNRENLIRPGLCEFRSIVAMEDGVSFLGWASDVADRFGWSEKRVIGGSSAGGITACNIAFGARQLGLNAPFIHGVFSCSGGYSYPRYVDPSDNFSVLALHNPNETRVSVDGVRMLKKKLGGKMELLESEAHIHGHCELSPGEPKWQTYERIERFVNKCVN